MRKTLLRGVAWMLLGCGIAGVTVIIAILLQGERRPQLTHFVILAGSALVAIPSRLFLWKTSDRTTGSAQLYTTDLLIASTVMAAYFALIQNLTPHLFIRYGVWGGAAVGLAMVLSLLHASRRGYTQGMQRGIVALSSSLNVLGFAATSPLLFFCIVIPIVDGFRHLRGFLRDETSQSIIVIGVIGLLALTCGQLLRLCIRPLPVSAAENAEFSQAHSD